MTDIEAIGTSVAAAMAANAAGMKLRNSLEDANQAFVAGNVHLAAMHLKEARGFADDGYMPFLEERIHGFLVASEICEGKPEGWEQFLEDELGGLWR